jgi:hypothetical protein
LAHQAGAIPGEMKAPFILTGIEERNQFSSVLIIACYVGPFESVAGRTSQAKIRKVSLPMVLSGADVIEFVRQRGECLR